MQEEQDLAPKENVLGVMVSAVNLAQVVATIEEWIAMRHPGIVCPVPAHTIMDSQKDRSLRQILNSSSLTTPDGMSIVWILRSKGHKQVTRVYGPDLMTVLCERSEYRAYRHFLYGGSPELVEELGERLTARFSGLKVAGVYSPPFRVPSVEEDTRIIEFINDTRPDIVWVGLGSPKQEKWMAKHRDRLDAPVLVGVGAAFDFLSGRKPQAPRWIQRSGVEWLFRLATEPRRLWPRYRQYPLFGLLVLAQMVGLRKFTLVED
jgi:N-acetylglucosaminyldiphosphoundecaprenol N-acetyl-beta-D-mannosaminyltransferase